MIQVLGQDVVNQIAAGEVLERPANLVKELIENSIDAGGTEIEIDLDHGGRILKIQDNGKGMSLEDLKLSLKRHATSKISNFSDIWSLNTYGFRGEALASAAAVSKMQITTRPKNAEKAFTLKSAFGNESEIQKTGGVYGTHILVEDLFENVPVRLKFLKSEASELAQIIKVIKAFALTHPHIAFKVKQKGILKQFYPPNQSLIDRAKLILDTKNLFEAQGESSQINTKIIFSSPNDVQKSSQNIWIFVQKRWIQDKALQKAILDAYRNLLMHGEYPSCVLYLDCDPQFVDVNIHPTKSQVKFQDSSQAFRSTHNTLRSALEKAPWLESLRSSNTVRQQVEPLNSLAIEQAVQSYSEQYNFHKDDKSSFYSTQFKQKESIDDFLKTNLSPSKQQSIQHVGVPQRIVGFQNYNEDIKAIDNQSYKIISDSNSNGQISELNNFENHQGFYSSSLGQQNLAISKQPLWGHLQVLSQVNLTYILAQSQTALFMIDQHAAHERVNFEKLMKGFSDNSYELQSFLIPLTIDLDPEKLDAILTLSKDLRKLGIEVEQSGPQSVSIISCPTIVSEKAIFEIVQKIAHDYIDAGESFAFQKSLGDLVATMACHSSIRAGQSLSSDEMKELLKQMDEFPLSTFCPHGRPVFKQFLFKELDRDFGRIV